MSVSDVPRMGKRKCDVQNTETVSKYFVRDKVSVKKDEMLNLRLGEKFFEKKCVEVAKALLGKRIVRNIENNQVSCKIVEVESYLSVDDKASHSYNGKKTNRNEAMFMKPGTLYVYMTYGMYHCMNISCGGPGDAVLIRAAEPIENVDIMKHNRIKSRKSEKELPDNSICNGPSKLCQALCIGKSMDKTDLTSASEMWLEDGDTIPDHHTVCCKRIGLSRKAGIWQHEPLRYYILDNKFVSVKDKTAESSMKSEQ